MLQDMGSEKKTVEYEKRLSVMESLFIYLRMFIQFVLYCQVQSAVPVPPVLPVLPVYIQG